ncbi:MAG: hypothetical protein KatS3mg040_1378 [Candidatus Kapaibacterium sp.]|nr:MAG: hypothetical protein KatS3mg040_1378 [Candidatus Kapabacteria bacterium]
MSSAFWKRFRNGRLDAILLAIAVGAGWLSAAAGRSSALAFDLLAIIGGEFWRAITAQWIAPNALSAIFTALVILTVVPRVVGLLGRGLFWFLTLLLSFASAVTVALALVAAGIERFTYPLPPIVMMLGLVSLFLPQKTLSIGSWQLRSRHIGAATVLGAVAIELASIFPLRAIDAFIVVGQWCVASAAALVGVGIVHHRALLRQFTSFQQSQPAHVYVSTESAYSTSHPHERPAAIPPPYTTEAEYADALLEKIFQQGAASLTEQERQFLKSYSQRL